MDKSREETPKKRQKNGSQETALAVIPTGRRLSRKSSESADETAIIPTKRGGGRGLKAVQTSHDQEKKRTKANGETEESKTKVKEQKLFHARSNAHVETKVVTEDNRKKVGKNGTTTITSSTTVKKVTYL